ncbi:hypothetical protein E1161_12180 [Saccharopolyspora aridisoli]|uniref:Uncharacterized protein n=1 Tax=Saccharopolyspora aridisoli TaxID=2530385 RepID=A0A4R4UUJ4_9PSEU|nr:hypothetical protein [Saccharopolyspora aridisoli]TDC92844.1 hypothetical protein E1161_12180 [Saccharopolyspora aridisoli]
MIGPRAGARHGCTIRQELSARPVTSSSPVSTSRCKRRPFGLADRAFRPILDALAELSPEAAPNGGLDRQLVAWRERCGGPRPPVPALPKAVRACTAC